MASSIVSPMNGSTSSSDPSSTTSQSGMNSLTNENTFLKLLVSQIQHQDPLNPTDGVQFLSQLTSFSQLEQLMQINQELAPASKTTTTTPAA